MNFDFQSVRTGCNGGFCHRFDIAIVSGCMRGIHNNREAGAIPKNRYGRQIERIPGGIFVGADASFAENNMGISLGHHIFRCI